jgi:hypothetical protein
MENTAVGIRHVDHVSPLYRLKLVLTSPTSGGRSVGVIRTQTTEFNFTYIWQNHLDEGSVVRKATTYTQQNTNRE